MADPNKLLIEKSAELFRVRVSDPQGAVHDITEAFRSIEGSTKPTGFSNVIKGQVDSTTIQLTFTAVEKKLEYVLPEALAEQLASWEAS